MASFYRPRVGISACLLGEAVRWDAGHKRDAYLVDVFGSHVEWVSVCPEVEAGFGAPRETMQLVRVNNGPVRLMTTRTAQDVTSRMARYARKRVEALAGEKPSGYVLKKDSPSCGMERVRVYSVAGVPKEREDSAERQASAERPPERGGRGLFAHALLTRFPNLPVEEEGRLSDPRLRENFIERVFAYHRVRALFESRWTLGDLVRFHTAHKLTLMAHSPAAYRSLGQLVATAGSRARAALATQYESDFMRALTAIATPKRHANVLEHMLGYFKKGLDKDSRAEIATLIESHRKGLVPLVVPMTLIKHHVRRERVEYLASQVYIDPHPRELSLRNHV
jgi:uncharacterized protein YbgA (DUF1722 family)/uncharacterized protein YbbK (DUF523 family)